MHNLIMNQVGKALAYIAGVETWEDEIRLVDENNSERYFTTQQVQYDNLELYKKLLIIKLKQVFSEYDDLNRSFTFRYILDTKTTPTIYFSFDQSHIVIMQRFVRNQLDAVMLEI